MAKVPEQDAKSILEEGWSKASNCTSPCGPYILKYHSIDFKVPVWG